MDPEINERLREIRADLPSDFQISPKDLQEAVILAKNIEISRLKARVNKLRAWLSLYSDHRPYCTDNGCECGFDELIGEAE